MALVTDDLPYERFYAMLKEHAPSTEPYIMTIAQQLEAKGRKDGRLEGLRDGRLEGLRDGRLEGLRDGRLEGLRSALFDLIQARTWTLSTAQREHIDTCDDLETLERWFRSAAIAASPAAIFTEDDLNA